MKMKELIEHIAVIATVLVSVVVSLLDFTGALENIAWLAGRTSAITLLVLAIVAIYLVSERTGKLNRVEKLIEMNAERLLFALEGVDVKRMNSTDEGLEYLVRRIRSAKSRVDHFAYAYGGQRNQAALKKWEIAVEKALKENKITYRYVPDLQTRFRWNRIKSLLKKTGIHKCYFGYYEFTEKAPPALSFVIFDDEEIVVRYSYEFGQTEIGLAIRHAKIIDFFSAYFENI